MCARLSCFNKLYLSEDTCAMAVIHVVCGHCYGIHYIQNAYTKVAAVDRHRKGGGAPLGPATSFVVSFVLALNRVNVVAGVGKLQV